MEQNGNKRNNFLNIFKFLFIYNALKKVFSIDTRSLALLRILIGLLILSNIVVQQFGDLKAFYTDEGIIPRHLQISLFQNIYPWQISIHLANGSYVFQLILLIIQAIFALTLTLGYKTRLSTFISWLFTASIINRNTLVYNGADSLIKFLLFWSLFVPLEEKWSIDTYKQKTDKVIFSPGTAGLILQMFCMYFFSALAKLQSADWISGEAVYYSLINENLTTQIGIFLSNFPEILKVLTYATLTLELVGPILLVSPFCTQKLRIICVPLFILFQLGLFLCMGEYLTTFPYIATVGIFLFTPKMFWIIINKFSLSQRLGKRVIGSIKESLSNAFLPSKTFFTSIKCLIMSYITCFLVACMILSNLYFTYPQLILLPKPLHTIIGILQLDQAWKMFTNVSNTHTFWNVFLAKQNNGEEIDLFQNTNQISWSKPNKSIPLYFKNSRWTNLYSSISSSYANISPYVANYLCNEWNSNHSSSLEKINELSLYTVIEQSSPQNIYDSLLPRISQTLLTKHKCN